MHKKFEINQTKIKGGLQSWTKVVTHDSNSDLPLAPKNRKYMSGDSSYIWVPVYFPKETKGFLRIWNKYDIFPLYLCIKRKNVGSQFVSAYQAIYGKYENKGRITFGSKMFKT